MKKNELCLAGSSCPRIGKLFRLQTSSILASIRVSGHFRPESPLYDARIMPKDLLTITVNTTDPETAAPFNLIVATTLSNQNKNLTNQPVLQQYLVDNKGNIDFPRTGHPAHRRTDQKRSREPHQRETENLHHGGAHRQCTHGQL